MVLALHTDFILSSWSASPDMMSAGNNDDVNTDDGDDDDHDVGDDNDGVDDDDEEDDGVKYDYDHDAIKHCDGNDGDSAYDAIVVGEHTQLAHCIRTQWWVSRKDNFGDVEIRIFAKTFLLARKSTIWTSDSDSP